MGLGFRVLQVNHSFSSENCRSPEKSIEAAKTKEEMDL
jgi:hypothetical protein